MTAKINRWRPGTVGVVGLGRVGLPLALSLAGTGLLTTGFDTDRAKVAALRKGESHLADELAEAADWFEPTTDASRLVGLDAYVICVPASAVEAAADTVAPVVTRDTLVVLPSDANEQVTRRLADGSGLWPGSDFHVTRATDLAAAAKSVLSLWTPHARVA
jgi:UDP-N-acetyl-D-mannosaminuronate dehydrogenase